MIIESNSRLHRDYPKDYPKNQSHRSGSTVQKLLELCRLCPLPWVFQCLTTLSVKNLFLVFNLILSCRSSTQFLQVLLLITRQRSEPAPLLPLD